MQITTIVAFALLFARTELRNEWLLVNADDVKVTLALCLVGPLVVGLGAFISSRRVRRLMDDNGDVPLTAQHTHHRAMFLLRSASVIVFAALLLLTPWSNWFALGSIHPALQIVGDWIVLSPFIASHLLLWIGAYHADVALRGEAGINGHQASGHRRHTFGAYLDFQVRHQLLVVAVPLSIILFASNMTRGYADALISWSRLPWMPDAILGTVAVLVFVSAPALLRRIWRTRPLEPGPLRERLERLCDRIGLKVREILVWDSDGLMVNAAVMGLIAPVRFVLLSDALLASMTQEQIEAVFGHEAGHVRHRHIQHFLVFAFVGWLIVAGIMELLARTWTNATGELTVSALAIQGIGVVATIVFWGIGFGWISRRFEWQADLFGAACVTPEKSGCGRPCSVHPDNAEDDPSEHSGRVCATGAAIFASALQRVALLNGIPPEEWSWRHSSIGNRIRFLKSVADDPARATRFQRGVRTVQAVMVICAVVGAAISLTYCLVVFSPVRTVP